MTLPDTLWLTLVYVGSGPGSADCLVAVHDSRADAMSYAGLLKKHAGAMAEELDHGTAESVESHRKALLALVGPDSLPGDAVRHETGQARYTSRWCDICVVAKHRDADTGRLTLAKGPPAFSCVYPFGGARPYEPGEEDE